MGKKTDKLPGSARALQTRIIGVVGVSALVLLACACGDSSTLPGRSMAKTLSGEISIEGSREALSHIPSSRVVVQLRDATLQDVSSVLIAEQAYEGVTTLPLTYELTWSGELDPWADYSVSADVYDETGALIFVTDTVFPVYPDDAYVDFHVISAYLNGRSVDEHVHAVELPGEHGLGAWLGDYLDVDYPDATSAGFIVPAGQYRDAGGVRFSCPYGGDDCDVNVMTCDGFEFMATSTGGKASAENNLVQLPGDARDVWAFAGEGLSVPAGRYRDVGGVRFACPAGGADCEVTFVYSYCVPVACPQDASLDDAVAAELCVRRVPGVVSLGGAATAESVRD